MDLKDAVFEDRKIRRGMSRREYAELTGVKEQRIHGLEHGRKLKAGEMEALSPFVGDLLGDDITPRRAEPQHGHDFGADDYLAERRGLEAEYLNVMNRLVGLEAPPFPWPSQFRIETAPPSDFQTIREWCKSVHEWIDNQSMVEVHPQETVVINGNNGDSDEGAWLVEEVEVIPPPSTTYIPQVATDDVRYVTNGELRTWKECRRKWYLESYRSLGRQTERLTGSAMVGTRYHQALAAWYQPNPGDPWGVFEENTREMEAQLDSSNYEDFQKDTDLVRAMLEGYFQWVEESGVDRDLTVIGSEMAVTANPKFPEFPAALLLGKLDVKVYRQWDNTVWFLDHKTVPDFTTATRTLHLDEQMLHYHLVERLSSDDDVYAAGALYNMARKVKRSATATPPFYRRDDVRFNREHVQSYWIRTRQTLGEIELTRTALDAGADHRAVAYPNPTRDCSWKCEFFSVCPMFDDGSRAEDFLSENYVTVNPLRRYEPEFEGRTA